MCLYVWFVRLSNGITELEFILQIGCFCLAVSKGAELNGWNERNERNGGMVNMCIRVVLT